MPGRIAHIVAIALIAVSAVAAPRRRAVPSVPTHFCDFGTDVPGVTVPDGFCIRKFADVPTPRIMLFAPNGDLFVSSPKRITPGAAPPGAGAIFVFSGTDPNRRSTFAQGTTFQTVHGILIAGDSFYYTLADGVYKVPYTAGSTTIDSATPQQIASFNTTNVLARFTHALAIANDGSIYTTQGQLDNSNCGSTDDPHLGTIMRVGPGHDPRGDIVARGMRNPLFIRCMPWDTCYAAELSGDEWESVGGTEKLIEIHDGDTFGYPCCVQKNLPNPNLHATPPPDCSQLATPRQTFPLHNTPFGFDWERDFGWPEPYKHAFFVGLHGDFANWSHAGLQWAPTDPVTHLPTQPTIDFALGFGRAGAISRVADVRFAPDGRLFFTSDQDGAIYWIAPRTLPRR